MAIKVTAASLYELVQRNDAQATSLIYKSVCSVKELSYGSELEQLAPLSLPELLRLCVLEEGSTSSEEGRARAMGVLLVGATLVERALGDVLHSLVRCSSGRPQTVQGEAATVPALLRDLLRSSMLINVLGAGRVRVLRLFLAAPAALNVRNVCWHGFMAPADFAPPYALLTLLMLAALEPLLRSLPVPFLKRRKLNLASFASPLPLDQLLERGVWREAVCASTSLLPRGRAPLVHCAAQMSHLPALQAALLLPVVEYTLRRLYVAHNRLPEQMLSAQSRVYYVRRVHVVV